jgi:hypothetical protein
MKKIRSKKSRDTVPLKCSAIGTGKVRQAYIVKSKEKGIQNKVDGEKVHFLV